MVMMMVMDVLKVGMVGVGGGGEDEGFTRLCVGDIGSSGGRPVVSPGTVLGLDGDSSMVEGSRSWEGCCGVVDHRQGRVVMVVAMMDEVVEGSAED